MESTGLGDITSSLLDGLNDERARSRFIDLVARYTGAPIAQLLIYHGAGLVLQAAYSGHAQPEFFELAERMGPQNPRLLAVPRMVVGKAITDRDILSEKEIAENEVYQELIIPRGHRHYAAVISARDERLTAGLAIYASEAHGPFPSTTLQRLEAVSSACEKLLDATLKITNFESHQLVRNAAILGPSAAIDRRGRIMDENEGFRNALKRGVVHKDSANRLKLFARDSDRRLEDMIEAAASSGMLRCLAGQNEGEDTHIAYFTKITGGHVLGINHGYVMVTLQPIEQEWRLSRKLTRDYFGLTEAETDVAQHLANGLSIAEISTLRGTEESTTRSLLKRVLSKTNSKRQGELVVKLRPFLTRLTT